jgi:hypothetical protein
MSEFPILIFAYIDPPESASMEGLDSNCVALVGSARLRHVCDALRPATTRTETIYEMLRPSYCPTKDCGGLFQGV